MPPFASVDFTLLELALLAFAALLVGLSKTAIPGAGTISVAVFAAVLPAKQSTGALLVLLLLGDLFAVWTYHGHADWAVLRRMVPAVLAGVLVGVLFLATADDATVRRIIGGLLLTLVAVTLVRRRAANSPREVHTSSAAGAGAAARAGAGADRATPGPAAPAGPGGWRQRTATTGYGILAGFTTMVANAGGPVMSMYFLAARFSVHQFLGTAAWFFFAVNLAKTPFSMSLGLISVSSLWLDLVLAPAVVIGAFLGRRVARRIKQTLFDALVIGVTILSAGYLVLA